MRQQWIKHLHLLIDKKPKFVDSVSCIIKVFRSTMFKFSFQSKFNI